MVFCIMGLVLLLSEEVAGAGEVGRGVDLHPEPGGGDQADRNTHSGFERAQLLEPFALFEHAARQPDKAFEGLAAIGVEPDMLVMRPIAPGYRRFAEVQRAGWPGRVDKTGNDLVDAGVGECGWVLDQ